MTAPLFQPISLGNLDMPNRIAVAPMCQYSADDGSASDWHLQQWMSYALSGAGMVTLEMTNVERRGRISHGCLGLYSDHNEAAAKRALDAARRVAQPGTKFGTQLAHAGRKASCQRPWEGGGPLKADQDPWQTVSASALAYDEGWHVPHALEDEEVLQVIERFADAARRAKRAGFDFIELHGAHGYLIFQFLSPLSNQRTDRWGGSLENRMRFMVEVARAVKKAAPGLMLGARLSVKDWVDGGFDTDEAIEVARVLKAEGLAYLCCSSGGNSPLQKLPTGAGYQVHLAEAVKEGAGIPVRAVGLIDNPAQANSIVADGRADMVALGRAFLADPRWVWRAAAELGEEIPAAPQFVRSETTIKHWMKAAG
ncbi:NADH:flavin oxidoreductase/NADH oxidase [Manganibacter manganicus]|uniref:Oxidoreductase n=1 Tax=Manganibacter manganicus TaxID=1873176 RepID=A0A1V8RTS8_9HYPH|nr:NADH:flavin oxidoreductase/NADH oxidase [Pseudaminobacter manganicus]OQM76600.1 oxidoreductase [Pseudaminobacter manganicus]